jgi:hypothetical protein
MRHITWKFLLASLLSVVAVDGSAQNCFTLPTVINSANVANNLGVGGHLAKHVFNAHPEVGQFFPNEDLTLYHSVAVWNYVRNMAQMHPPAAVCVAAGGVDNKVDPPVKTFFQQV